jgi:predicted negative regulator of RcsB-dependent stress response
LAREGLTEFGQETNVAYVDEHIGDVMESLGDKAGAEAKWRSAERVYAEFRASRELARVRVKLEDAGRVRAAVEDGQISVASRE